MASMVVTIDRAGRVVIPKPVRDLLALGPEVAIEVVVEGDSMRLTPQRPPSRSYQLVDGFPRIDPAPGITTTDADVQEWRDADRR